jgi:putative transposase
MGKKRMRRRFEAAFKATVALAAIRGDKTLSELASEHQVHANLISQWKRRLLANVARVFEEPEDDARQDHQAVVEELHLQVGKLHVELDWLKKKLPSSTAERRRWIEPVDQCLSVADQCAIVGLPRSTYYHAGVGESDENLALMRVIDEQYLQTPFFGSRGMTQWLKRQGYAVNRKRVQRLMRLMDLEAIYPRQRTSDPCQEHHIYPYLLRNITIERPDQVWSADITYVPLARGFMYLVAVLDWHSRYVLSWELSNTLDSRFCVSALQAALAQRQPEIFNTDQGAQFTSQAFTGVLEQSGIAISMYAPST